MLARVQSELISRSGVDPSEVGQVVEVRIESVISDDRVLAREIELVDREDYEEQTQIELEYFCHGALCVCYSGQCYMSYAIGGRSGNRGECAQPCRRRYHTAEGNGFFFSLTITV